MSYERMKHVRINYTPAVYISMRMVVRMICFVTNGV
jgi:hypothetical protein